MGVLQTPALLLGYGTNAANYTKWRPSRRCAEAARMFLLDSKRHKRVSCGSMPDSVPVASSKRWPQTLEELHPSSPLKTAIADYLNCMGLRKDLSLTPEGLQAVHHDVRTTLETVLRSLQRVEGVQTDAHVPHCLRFMIRKNLGTVLENERACFDAPLDEEAIIDKLRARENMGYVAEQDGTVVGHMIYGLHDRTITLLDIAVDPTKRGSGVGEDLLGKLIMKLDGKNSRTMLLDRVNSAHAQTIGGLMEVLSILAAENEEGRHTNAVKRIAFCTDRLPPSDFHKAVSHFVRRRLEGLKGDDRLWAAQRIIETLRILEYCSPPKNALRDSGPAPEVRETAPIIIRPITERELLLIHDVLPPIATPTSHHRVRTVTDLGPDTMGVVAERGGEAVGYCTHTPTTEGPLLRLSRFSVAETAGKDPTISRALATHLLAWLNDAKMPGITFDIAQDQDRLTTLKALEGILDTLKDQPEEGEKRKLLQTMHHIVDLLPRSALSTQLQDLLRPILDRDLWNQDTVLPSLGDIRRAASTIKTLLFIAKRTQRDLFPAALSGRGTESQPVSVREMTPAEIAAVRHFIPCVSGELPEKIDRLPSTWIVAEREDGRAVGFAEHDIAPNDPGAMQLKRFFVPQHRAEPGVAAAMSTELLRCLRQNPSLTSLTHLV